MRIKQILESVSAGGMGTGSIATAPAKAGKMIKREKGNLLAQEEQGVAEVSLGDYRKKAAMQKAQSQMGAMFGKPEEREKNLATFNKREKGLNRLKARDEKARAADQQKQITDLVARLPELEAEYEKMRAEYKSLGGSDWQYADREQNLTPGERKARDMEGPMNNLWRQIQAAKKHQGVAEGSEIKIPTEDGITMQDIRLMAGEGKLTKKTVLQAIAVIRKQRREQGVAEDMDDKIAQLKKDHDTAVHWSKNEKSPQKREAARQKAEKIKRHLETQYKQGVAEGSDQGTKMSKTCARCGGSLFRFPNTIKCHKCNQTWKASPKNKEQGVAEGSEQIYNILALDKGNALKKPTKLKWKASSLEDIFDALAAQDWYPLEINGVEVIAGKRLKQGVAEDSLEEYGDTAKGQKMLTKVQKRAVDRVVSKKADTDPKYAKKNSDTANRAWDRMTDKDLEENKKGVRAVKHTSKAKGIEPPKPRNFVAKNAKMGGAGAHKDKKKAQKQGDTKHKAKEPAYESRLWAALERKILK
jgi:hypothetical protein